MASVWVPFTSESKDAIANYPEIIQETTLALQECGRRLSVNISRRKREAEAERKKGYIEKYIPHLAMGIKDILALGEKDKTKIEGDLKKMLEKTHLEV
jgi:DNA topoisomerase-6 subunit B